MLNVLNLLASDTTTSDSSFLALRVVSYVLIVLMSLAAITAVILVLMQPGNSTGVSALGGSSETFFGKNKGKSIEARMKKWTVLCLIVLAILSVAFYVIYGFAW